MVSLAKQSLAGVLGGERNIARPYIVPDRSKIKILNVRDSNATNAIVEH
jgi:hypothetical protein